MKRYVYYIRKREADSKRIRMENEIKWNEKWGGRSFGSVME